MTFIKPGPGEDTQLKQSLGEQARQQGHINREKETAGKGRENLHSQKQKIGQSEWLASHLL